MSPIEKIIWVNTPCNQDRINEQEVEFIDIWEDFEGRDVLKFKCPLCFEIHESQRFG